MQILPLSKHLADIQAAFARYSHGTGAAFDAPACARIADGIAAIVQRAVELEACERNLAQMEAVARDLDLVAERQATHLSALRSAVAPAAASLPGTNVVLFPIVPRPTPQGGAA